MTPFIDKNEIEVYKKDYKKQPCIPALGNTNLQLP